MITKDYIAGFVDGEGNIYCYKRKDSRTAKGFTINALVGITGTDEKVIVEMNKLCAGKLYLNQFNGKKSKPIHRLFIQDIKTIKTFLESIIDKLIVKREQAKLMVEYCESRMENKDKTYSKREIELAERITKLNRRGKGNSKK